MNKIEKRLPSGSRLRVFSCSRASGSPASSPLPRSAAEHPAPVVVVNNLAADLDRDALDSVCHAVSPAFRMGIKKAPAVASA